MLIINERIGMFCKYFCELKFYGHYFLLISRKKQKEKNNKKIQELFKLIDGQASACTIERVVFHESDSSG
jgi:hypothetical protein